MVASHGWTVGNLSTRAWVCWQTRVVHSRPPSVVDAPPVVIRRYRGGDLPALFEAVSSSRQHLAPWMPWASIEPLKPALADFVARSVNEFEEGKNFDYALWDDRAASLVGGTGLHPRLGPGRIEIGYWVRVGWLRQGIATSVAHALTTVAFSMPEIHEVHIHCDEANVASAAVPRRLGFRLERVVADEVTASAEVGRSMEWVIGRNEWPAGVLPTANWGQ